MGVFDYYCLINSESCLLINSQGQDCSFGEVYLVDKDLTKKIKAEYSGYGYAKVNGEEVFDLGFDEDFALDNHKNTSFISCKKCAKKIIDEVYTLDDFFKEIDEDPKIINKKKIDFKEKELNDLIICRNEINKKIRIKRKEIEKLNY